MPVLSDAAGTALLAAPARLDVLFRPGGGRWKKLGTVSGYAAGLALVDRAGDFWFRRVGPGPAGEVQPSLFDEVGDGGAG